MNHRDLGGLPLVNGGVTPTGRLSRGGFLTAGDEGRPWEPESAPGVVIDLRGPAEVEAASPDWPEGTEVLRLDVLAAAAPALARGDMVGLYAGLLEAFSPFARVALDALVDDSDRPGLIHCAAGKDRTGVVIGLLLLAGGVSTKAVLRDYLESERASGVLVSGEQPTQFTVSEQAFRRTVLDLGGRGAADWLAAKGGVATRQIQHWRAVLGHAGLSELP